MISEKLFQSSVQVVEWLRKIAKPLIDSEGAALLNTGIVRVTVPQEVIDTLLYGGAQQQDILLWLVYDFVRDGRRYGLIVEKNALPNKHCVFMWDHRLSKL